MITIAMACVGALVFPAVAAETTVTGMLVEAGCGLNLGETGPSEEHVACMVRCAANGDPVAIVTDAGVYRVTGDWPANNGDALSKLMAQQVVATGEVTEQGGQLLLDISTIELAR